MREVRLEVTIRGRNRFLYEARVARDMNQSDAAHFAGVSKISWGNWERLKNWPKKDTQAKVAAAFGVSAEEIFPVALAEAEGLLIKKVVEIDAMQFAEIGAGLENAPALLPEYTQEIEAEELKRDLDATMRRVLTGRERHIMELSMDEEGRSNLDYIGMVIGVSGARVAQIRDRAMRKLRHVKGLREHVSPE